MREQGTGAVAEAVVARWLTPGYAAAHPDLRQRLRAMIAADARRGLRRVLRGRSSTWTSSAELDRIAAPTLVIAGADDPATPPDHGARIAARVPGARMAVVPDSAHLANIQQAAEVSSLILRHLQGSGI